MNLLELVEVLFLKVMQLCNYATNQSVHRGL